VSGKALAEMAFQQIHFNAFGIQRRKIKTGKTSSHGEASKTTSWR
jgi:hypothetical protein